MTEKENDIIDKVETFKIRHDDYERVMRGFYKELQEARRERTARTGDYRYTEYEVLMTCLVSFLLPDKKCRAVMDYYPAAERIRFFREYDQNQQSPDSQEE